MNLAIVKYAGKDIPGGHKDVHALTAMIIGAVAIARTIDDKNLVQEILTSCRQQARMMLGGI